MDATLPTSHPQLPRHYRLVAFDFDGTLADSLPFFLANVDTVTRRHGLRSFDSAQLEAMRGMSSREFMRLAGIKPWQLPRIVRDFHHLMSAQIEQVHLFEGIASSLQALATAGVPLALVTSNSEANVRRVLGDSLAAAFTHYDCGVALFGKASRLRRLARRAGAADAALYIGDELRDAEAARDAGFDFAAVAWGYTRIAALLSAQPTHVFGDPRELTFLLRRAAT